ncbi:MAG: hypothetical protein HYW45_01940 [Candidatus Daviesbacteria bacterium]|nr:MAG: hypothetical protein HYW45_01940 [Candidatus Daviesbacteria bacterium]
MKKLSILTASATALLNPVGVWAADTTIQIKKPDVGFANISDFLNAGIRLIFIIALIIALVMLVWGAVEWILSGGNKDAIGNARGRIIHALVGLAILAVAFAIVQLAGGFLGVDLLREFTIPSPQNPTPSLSR